MKRHLPKSAAMLVLVMLLSGCAGTSSASSDDYTAATLFIKVTAKEHSDDYKQKWIVAHNSSMSNAEDIRLIVDSNMVWNLIEVGSEYFATYEGSAAKGYRLNQISHPGDQDTIR